MKKVILLLGLILLLAACSGTYVEDEKFIFTEDEFKEVYEEVNDKNMPTNIEYYPEVISIRSGNKSETTEFLDSVAELLNSDEARRLSESIKNDEDNIPHRINGEGFSILFYDEYESYDISVNPFEVEE